MEYRRILIDTNIIIEYLRKQNKEQTQFVKLFKDYNLCLSVISVFELYNGAVNAKKYSDIEIVCKNIEVIDIDLSISKKASAIYRKLRSQNKLIEFRDILIGATAIEHKISIATKNKKHFNRLPQINIFD